MKSRGEDTMRGSGDGAERVISDFKVAITIDTGCSHFHQFLGHLERNT